MMGISTHGAICYAGFLWGDISGLTNDNDDIDRSTISSRLRDIVLYDYHNLYIQQRADPMYKCEYFPDNYKFLKYDDTW